MRVMLATEAGRSTGGNEDWAGSTTSGLAVLLDGLTEGGDTGCRHGTEWFVGQLGVALLARAVSGPLADALAGAIGAVADAHRDSCDLTHPGSPCTTVAILRPEGTGTFDYLVLSDAVAVFDTDTGPLAVTDRSNVGIIQPEPGQSLAAFIVAQQRLRNVEGGYWVAQHDPQAAQHALTGRVDGAAAGALLSDGAALLVTDFGAWSWRELLDVAYERGPGDVIAATRELERQDATRTVFPRYKTHDDATIVVVRV